MGRITKAENSPNITVVYCCFLVCVGKPISAEIRERDWCNVVTCHIDTPRAYVWRLHNFVLGEHILTPCPENPTPVKCCAISVCGNFAVLGNEGGWIERFNLQSGISRGSYVDISESRGSAHDGEVVGISCDATNRAGVIISVNAVFSGLLAAIADDMVLRLYDVVALRMVRKFEGHTDRVTDLCFSEDGKWLVSSSMDGSLRIWDVILARQIDAIHVDVAITALSLSPNMDILATSHVDQNGVYLWVNQVMFSGVSNVDTYVSGKEVVKVQLPSISLKEGSEHMDEDPNNLLERPEDKCVRNKPLEPPKKPEKAPFFLPSVPTPTGEILFKPGSVTGEEVKDTTKDQLVNISIFTNYIKGLSPSTLDMELRMLQIIDDEDLQELQQRPELHSIELLLDYFIHETASRNNFEFIQAVIRLFLKIHGETVRKQLTLQEKAKRLLEIQGSVWQRIDRMFQSSRCMVAFLSNTQF
ncbi:hypothetical protein ACLOJK_030886 [Asimina triloba]